VTYRELLAGNADFRRLWTGQVVSEVGDWLNNIAVLALVIQLAGEGRVGLSLAVYAIARHLPLFLFGPVAGVVVDRADRRRVMIAADVLRAALALGFLLAARTSSLALIYVVGAAIFSVSAFFNAAKRASVPGLVGRADELLAANSLSASTTAATIAAGSALGGVAATALGRDAVFVINALTFLASAEMIRRITKRLRVDEGDAVRQSSVGRPTSRFSSLVILGRMASDFREGLRYVRRDAVVSAVFVVVAGWGLGNGAARALYSIFGARLGAEAVAGWAAGWPALVERPTDFGISVLFVAMGVGGLSGATLAKRFSSGGGAGLEARMGRSLFLDGCGLAAFSLMPSLWTAAAVLLAREMNFAIWWTAQQTIVMRRTEDAFAGRVFASFETLTTLMMIGSMLVCGAVADAAGIRPVAAAGGSVVILSGALWFVLRKKNRGFEISNLKS
jgi:MFS family permease